MEARILGHEHADAALDMVGGRHHCWVQRDQQAAIVYLLEEKQSPQSSISREEASPHGRRATSARGKG